MTCPSRSKDTIRRQGVQGATEAKVYALRSYARKDLQKMEKFIQGKPLSEQEIGRQLLAETASYAESSVCRRRSLLHYFGETYGQRELWKLRQLSQSQKKVEAKDDLCAALETIAALKEKFKTEYIVDVMMGRASADVRSYRHDETEVFGCCEARVRNSLML